MPYPLQIVARQPAKYFRTREEWRMTDVLMNPMVIMLIAAFFLLIVTPKLASQDPQVQKVLYFIILSVLNNIFKIKPLTFLGNAKCSITKS